MKDIFIHTSYTHVVWNDGLYVVNARSFFVVVEYVVLYVDFLFKHVHSQSIRSVY